MITDIETGCWVDSHWGQYAGEQMVRLVDQTLGTDFMAEWPRDDDGEYLGTYGALGTPFADLLGDETVGVMVDIMDKAESALNDALRDDGLFCEWADGDFFVTDAYADLVD